MSMSDLHCDITTFINDNPCVDLNGVVDYVCELLDINCDDWVIENASAVYFEHEDVKFRLGLV